MANNTASAGLKVALGIALALFIGTGIYTASLYKDKKQNELELTDQKNDVLKDLNVMASKYDVALSENQVTNQSLVEARERIKGLIDSVQVSETNVKNLRRYYNKYNSVVLSNFNASVKKYDILKEHCKIFRNS